MALTPDHQLARIQITSWQGSGSSVGKDPDHQLARIRITSWQGPPITSWQGSRSPAGKDPDHQLARIRITSWPGSAGRGSCWRCDPCAGLRSRPPARRPGGGTPTAGSNTAASATPPRHPPEPADQKLISGNIDENLVRLSMFQSRNMDSKFISERKKV